MVGQRDSAYRLPVGAFPTHFPTKCPVKSCLGNTYGGHQATISPLLTGVCTTMVSIHDAFDCRYISVSLQKGTSPKSYLLPSTLHSPHYREIRTPVMKIRIKAPVDSVGGVYHAVSDCERLAEEFTADGSVVVKVAVELSSVSIPSSAILPCFRGGIPSCSDQI